MEKNDIKQALKNVKEFDQIGSFVMGVAVVVILSGGIIYGLTKMKFRPFSFYSKPIPSSEQVTPSMSITELKELPGSPDLYEKDGEWYVHNLPAQYEVRLGDSSWKVALAVYGSGENYRDIESENNMKNNQDLVVGQKITLPNVPSKKTGVIVEPTATAVPSSTPNPTTTPSSTEVEGNSGLPTKHVVQKSEGLWQISQKYYNDGYKYMKIYEANRDKMKNPEDISVGMELNIPKL
ncbi:MAG: LysM peptidoglycan-binding domain-containing protein [Patescibacteria group bacterium]